MYLILLRKIINRVKDKGILLSTLIILVYFDKLFGKRLRVREGQKKAPSGRVWTGGVQA
jgi:hypothetical protein